MRSLSAFFLTVVLTFSLLTSTAFSHSQNGPFSALSLCWRNCFNSSGGSNCDSSLDTYVSCICNLASQSLLTTAITCIRSDCPSDLTTTLPLEPLEATCREVGSPISSSALAAAESAERSAAVVSDYSYMTTSDGGLIGTSVVTVTDDAATATTITVDTSSASASGEQSAAEIRSSTTATTMSMSSLVAGGGASSTSMSAAASTSTSAAVLASETGTTDAAAASSTTAPSSSHATSLSNSAGSDSAVKTEGAPLGMQGTGSRREAGSVLGLTVWLLAGIVWF